MTLIRAFLLATAWCYLAAAFYVMLGKPAMIDVDRRIQLVFYYGLFSALVLVCWNPEITVLNLLLGAFYSFGAVGSFIGWPQKWYAYWTLNPKLGSDAGQIAMAFWDLALSVSFFYLFHR